MIAIGLGCGCLGKEASQRTEWRPHPPQLMQIALGCALTPWGTGAAAPSQQHEELGRALAATERRMHYAHCPSVPAFRIGTPAHLRRHRACSLVLDRGLSPPRP